MAVVSQIFRPEEPSNRLRYGVLYVERKLHLGRQFGYWRQEHTNAVAALLSDPSGASFDVIDPATGKHPSALARVNEVDLVFLTPAAQARFLATVPWPGMMPSGSLSTDTYGQLNRPCRTETQRGPVLNCMTNQFMARWPNADRTTAYNLISGKMNELLAARAAAAGQAAAAAAAAEQAAAIAAEQEAKAAEEEQAAAAAAAAAAAKKRTWFYVGGGAAVLALGVWALSRRR